MEGAAKLANQISKLRPASPMADIQRVLKGYYSERKTRMDVICDTANDLTRIEALSDFSHKLMGLTLLPNLGTFIVDVTTDMIVGADKVDALPIPPRALTATMPWDPTKGVGKQEKKWQRALWALPLLLVLYGSKKTLLDSLSQLQPALDAAIEAGKLTLENGETFSLASRFVGIASIDRFLKPFVAFFAPVLGNMDPAGRMQTIALLADLVPLQGIWMVEGIRRGNFLTSAHLL